MEELLFIRPRTRHILDTGITETDQPLSPFTGKDFSGSAVTRAVTFWHAHQLPDWQQQAACKQMDQAIFYGEEDRTGKARHHPNLTVDEVARARKVCNSCPVQLECLEYAITNREEFGIWGGSTAGQRKKWIRVFEQSYENVLLLNDEDTDDDDVFGGTFDPAQAEDYDPSVSA